MESTRHYLAQLIVEVDCTHPDFNAAQVSTKILAALQSIPGVSSRDVKVYPLAFAADQSIDVNVAKYEYRDFEVQIRQNAESIGTNQPTYYGVIYNYQDKHPHGALVDGNHDSREMAEAAAREYVDTRIRKREKKRSRP